MINNRENKDSFVSQFENRLANKLSIINIVILSIAGLAITWCTYQSTLWSGIQTFRFASASGAFRDAEEKREMAMHQITIDGSIIISFVNAVVANDTPRIKFYVERARPQLRWILDKWMRTDPINNKEAPLHPALTEGYQHLIAEKFTEVDIQKKRGQVYLAVAERANKVANNYVLMTVVFSVVMFLCGVATKITPERLFLWLNVIAGLICFGVLIFLFFKMPIASGNSI